MKTIKLTSTLILLFTLLISCNNDDDNNNSTPTPSNREIKYEITGTYSGHLDVVYSDVNGINKSEVITSLPWSKTITYPANIIEIGIGSSSVIANAGVAGETGSMKIYSGTTIKRESNKVVGQNGLLIFDSQSYNFQ